MPVRTFFRGRRRSRRAGALLVLLAGLLSLTFIANSVASATGSAWPGSTIGYYNASDWKQTVALAVRRWNSAETGVRFVAVPRRSEAQVVLVSASPQTVGRHCPHDDGAGVTTLGCSQIGYQDGWQAKVTLPAVAANLAPGPGSLRLVVHELGHVLGLRHLRGCAVMNPDVFLPGCAMADVVPLKAAGAGVRALCGPFPADLAALGRLYGKRVTVRRLDPYCLLPSAS